MIRNTLSASQSLAFALICVLAMSSHFLLVENVLAQAAEESSEDAAQGNKNQEAESDAQRSFKLIRDDETAANKLAADDEVEAWLPKLESGTLDISLSIGFLNLNTTLLQHDQIIYKYTTESTFWGDVDLKGKSAFSPTLRLGYNLTGWLAFEGWAGMSVSEYNTRIVNRHSRKNEPDAPIVDDPPLGEFDAETRSLVTLQTGLNVVVYPLDIFSDRTGRFHPYVTAGAGNMWYSMNSNYVKELASSADINVGLGLIFLADRNVSIRVEILTHRNEFEWTPSDYFVELDEGTTLVPLDEFPQLPDGTIDQKPVTEFESNVMNLLQFTIGAQVSF